MKLKTRYWYIFVIIIAFQLVTCLYWAGQKTNYFVDEFFSMGYARNFYTLEDSPRYIYNSPEFAYNEWIENSDFQKYLLLSDDEKFYSFSPLRVIKKLLTGRPYFGLLNVFGSVFVTEYITSFPALILNILCLVVSDISLFSLMRKAGYDEIIALLSVAMFGSSCYIISAAEYIRFYMMVIMLHIILLNLMHRLWNAQSWKEIILCDFAAVITLYFSYRNSELTLIFFGAFVLCFIISLVITKRWKQLISLAVICSIGIVYIALATDYIGILLHPENYDPRYSVAVTASIKLSNTPFENIFIIFSYYLSWVKTLLATYYFSDYWIIILFIGAVTLYLVFSNLKAVKTGVKIRDHAKNSGTKDIKAMRIATIFRSNEFLFMLILFGAGLIYSFICSICGYRGVWRYFCFGFVSLTIIIWYVADRLLKRVKNEKRKRVLIIIISVFIGVNALLPFKTRNIEYMFENEREFVNSVKNSQESKVVMILNGLDESKTLAGHEFYDGVAMFPPDTKMLILDFDHYEDYQEEFPKDFILWCDLDTDITDVMSDLMNRGYDLKDLGYDRCSKAYLCQIK